MSRLENKEPHERTKQRQARIGNYSHQATVSAYIHEMHLNAKLNQCITTVQVIHKHTYISQSTVGFAGNRWNWSNKTATISNEQHL